MSKPKSSSILEAGDQLFKIKDYRAALKKYERALSPASPSPLSPEEKTVLTINLIYFQQSLILQYTIISLFYNYNNIKYTIIIIIL